MPRNINAHGSKRSLDEQRCVIFPVIGYTWLKISELFLRVFHEFVDLRRIVAQ